MAKKIFNMITIMFVAIATSAMLFTGCTKLDDIFDFENKTQGGNPNGPGIHTTITRDGENGIADVIKRDDKGNVIDSVRVTVYLGGVNFVIDPNDTINVVSPAVTNTSFTQVGNATTSSWETDSVFYTKTVKNYTHTLNLYNKAIVIDYLDAYTYVWNVKIDFPRANGSVTYDRVNVLDNGINGANRYWLSETFYNVSFMGANSSEKGFKTLRTDVDVNEKLISTTLTDQGYQTLTNFVLTTPGTARSWIEITRLYEIAGPVKTIYEVILKNHGNAPAPDMKILPSFTISLISPVLTNAVVSGNRTEGDIQITEYSRSYTVGNNQFNKTFGLSYETAVWSDGTNSFPMPHREYQGISDGNFVMTDMTPITGFDRKNYVHTMNATFNSNPVSLQAQTEIRVARGPEDELLSWSIAERGFDYVNPTTSNTWIKIREIWSVSGTKERVVPFNVFNGIASESRITRIVNDFGLSQSNPNLGSSLLKSTSTQGDFIVRTYERTYTVGNNIFNRVFTMTYQRVTYSPLAVEMEWREYENITDGGFAITDMSNTTSSGTVYNRKNYVHTMTAVFNARNASATGDAELWKEVIEERETPSWLGNPIGAVYTRVIKNTNTHTRFEDMIVFQYQNGAVLAPNGVVDLTNKNLIFAYNQSTAATNGVKYSFLNNVNSAVWVPAMNNWFAAKISFGQNNWSYDGSDVVGAVPYNFVVHQNQAQIHGIGVDVTPIPSAQSFVINNGRITITYNKGNLSTTAGDTSSLK